MEIQNNLFQGRINRRNYLLGQLLIIVAFYSWLIIAFLHFIFTPNSAFIALLAIIYVLIYILVLIFEVSLTVRRFHDVGKSSQYAWFLFFPLFCILWLLFKKGQENNIYGEKPSKKIKFPADIVKNHKIGIFIKGLLVVLILLTITTVIGSILKQNLQMQRQINILNADVKKKNEQINKLKENESLLEMVIEARGKTSTSSFYEDFENFMNETSTK